ncbi:MAG: hypothetical protein IKA01_10055 [Alistipes sp.]|nr:hypothetical protein [Alistipes sp.]
MAEMLANMEPEYAVVKIDALKTKSGKPDLLAIDLVRALIVHSKYRLLFLFTDVFADVEEQIEWLNENVYKHDQYEIIRAQLMKRMICANSWAEVLRHPRVTTRVDLAIVDEWSDVKMLYEHSKVKPIFLPRRP